jgi:hypothetical protein
MPTFARVRRKRGPALAWTPTQDSYYAHTRVLQSEGRLPLYLAQAAILEFEAHLRESPLQLPFGLLAGDVCACPQTKLEYLLVDTVSRARVELGGDDPYAQLAEELQSLASEQSGKGKVAIGWYLGGLADDLTLDDDVRRLHVQLFPERWHLALVRGATSGVERGAFVRYESIWNRWCSIPFFEFLPERAGQKEGERRTAIRWENYRADEPTRPLDESEESLQSTDAAPPPSWSARLFGASLEPLRWAERGTPRRVAERARAPIAPSPLRPPEPPRVQPVERKVAVPVVDTVTAPIERKLTAPVEPKVTAPVEQVRAAPVDEKVATIASPAETRVVREEPESEVQCVFIDGILVPVPLAPELSQKTAMPPGSDRVNRSLVAVGALLSLIRRSLYLVLR